MKSTLILSLVLSLGFAWAAPADVILLTNGKTLEGQVQDLGNGKVRIRLSAGSLTVASSQIETVQPARTFEEILAEELERLDPRDADGRYRLARRARAEQHDTLSRRLLEEVIAVDPDHEAARRQLGYISHDGSWVTEEQLHALRGEIQFRGEWVSPSLRDQVLLDEARRLEEARESRRQAWAQREAEQRAALQREAEEKAAQRARQQEIAQAAAWAVARQGSGGCAFGNFGGFSLAPYGYSAFGAGFQTLEPFQPGRIQVPRQSFSYSFRQIHHSRAPAPLPLARPGYRRDPPPARR